MKQPTTVHYTSSGLKPPVFIITSLSEPQWDVVEMEHSKNARGEHEFTKTFNAEPGQYQYKFRLGPGDWWVFDEDKPTVDDGFGNKNNLLTVKPQPSQPAKPLDQERLTPGLGGQRVSIDAAPTPAGTTPAPLMDHESYFPQPSKSEESAALTPAPAPLLSHETNVLPPAQSESFGTHPPITTNDEGSAHPLLPHEALSPDTAEQHHSPLFRHESNGLHNRHDEPEDLSPSKSTKTHKQVQEEATHTDHHLLDKFPTDEQGILDTLRRASGQASLAEGAADAGAKKSPESRAVSDGSVTALESVKEDEVAEGQSHIHDSVTVDPRPKAPATPPLTPAEGKEPESRNASEDEATRREEREQAELDADKTVAASKGALQLAMWFVRAIWQWLVLFARGKKPVP